MRYKIIYYAIFRVEMPKTYSYGTQPTGYRRNPIASRMERKMPLWVLFLLEKNFFCPQFGGSFVGSQSPPASGTVEPPFLYCDFG
jgi:hypothetical protein